MGLDILILTDNHSELHTPAFFEKEKEYSLSRTFCNLMCRQNVINIEPELDQIGKITGIDIAPLYEMETYRSENSEEMEFFLEMAATEEEKTAIREDVEAANEKLRGNIDKVMAKISLLISKLNVITDLPLLLDDGGNDTLNNKIYFADFTIDKGDGYIGNNFGQDLRNFKRFLEHAKSKGAATVYFNYG